MFEDDDLQQDQDIEQADVEITDDLPDDEPSDEPQDSQDDEAQADDDLGFSFDEAETDSEGHDPFAGQAAPEWVKQLRKENRELKKQLKQTPQQPQVAPLREKPTITDHDFDSEAYASDLEQWLNEKVQYDAQKAKDEAIDNRYVASVDKMRKIAADYDEVEDTVVATLSPEKQALLKLGVEDTAKLVYALGKSPNKLAELEQLDPVSFVKQLGIMEFQMSQKSRNPNKPQPKQHELTGAAGGGDSKLAKLEAEAAKTGDRSKVVAYRKSLKK